MSERSHNVPALVRGYVSHPERETLEALRASPLAAFDFVASQLGDPTSLLGRAADQREGFTALVDLAVDLADSHPEYALERLRSLPTAAGFAATCIAAGMKDAAALPLLLDSLHSTKATTRLIATEGLIHHPSPTVMRRLLELLADRSDLVRSASLDILASIATPDVAAEMAAIAESWAERDEEFADRIRKVSTSIGNRLAAHRSASPVR